MYQVYPPLGPGNAHVAESPFLFHLLRVVKRPYVRQEPVFHTYNEYHRELQPLSLVQRNQGHGVDAFIKSIHV